MNYQLESKAAVAGLFDMNFRNKIDVPVKTASIRPGEAVFYNPGTKEFVKTPSATNVFLGIAMFSQLDGDASETNCLSVLQEGIIWVLVAETTDTDAGLGISADSEISDGVDFAFGGSLIPFDTKVETTPSNDKVMRCIVNVNGGKILEEAEEEPE
jgi:hypothetical protein